MMHRPPDQSGRATGGSLATVPGMSDGHETTGMDGAFDEGQFENAIIRILGDGGWIEIAPVSEPMGAAGVAAIDEPVHVISGCNPGYRETDEVNARRHRELELRLRKLGPDPSPAVGMSPDRSWVEPSWAVAGLSRKTVCALGQEFGQVAVFEVDSDRIRVVRCADSEAVSSRPYCVVESREAES